ncbi:hypothetical protein SDRG_16505 [Saprolegnia diclina VS20]|uniref:Uncharacterized protein n=1 Tax=Saprolegnia diclina (strain VS20) TaxID=1156394 RepID=T0PX94_SAPDV|nr:hypothetical protein SDRG_16505 [Saprolegnia diclina VS20]EQC25650.1 hypothetical protein SDRG_16505 [Saprolegnia diclina VS20]|eukprot:XP_008620941.1 hypothetical protein SDRG_16505 [Saprolegnia diclina VS20]
MRIVDEFCEASGAALNLAKCVTIYLDETLLDDDDEVATPAEAVPVPAADVTVAQAAPAPAADGAAAPAPAEAEAVYRDDAVDPDTILTPYPSPGKTSTPTMRPTMPTRWRPKQRPLHSWLLMPKNPLARHPKKHQPPRRPRWPSPPRPKLSLQPSFAQRLLREN